MERGTGDEPDENSKSRAEKRLERAQGAARRKGQVDGRVALGRSDEGGFQQN